MKKLIVMFLLTVTFAAQAQTGSSATSEWQSLFDGKTLAGWKAGGPAESFRVVDGSIAVDGPRSHLFYVGPDGDARFVNFEFEAEVMTRPGANSGIFFHARVQDDNWLDEGFEVQINNTQPQQGDFYETKKTGSLYGIRNQYKSLVKDNEWFRLNFSVCDRRVQVRLNNTLLVDYIEPLQPALPNSRPARRLGQGTFALQCHDGDSKVFFRNLRVRRLSDTLPPDKALPVPVVDDAYRQIINLQSDNYPLFNAHVHLKGGLTLEEALKLSRQTGICYGIAVNCGKGFSVTDDAGIDQYLKSMKNQPVFVAMQAEGREWMAMFSPEAIARFDYVFTDSMTYTDDQGRRMRLWIKDEVFVDDKQAFMETLVSRAVGILTNEPIDIYVNPTFLPEVIAAEYDTLWTEERMRRVIDAAAANQVAIEINARYRLPSPRFIKLAKQAGVKFSLGTNNTDNKVGELDYCLQMIRECGLVWQDMFLPRPDGQKPVQIKKKP